MVTSFKEYEKALGARLREVREQNNLSQAAAAAALHITRATLNRYENAGRIPDAEFIFSFAKHFNADPSWIISGVEYSVGKDSFGQLAEPGNKYSPEIQEIIQAVQENEKLLHVVLDLVRMMKRT